MKTLKTIITTIAVCELLTAASAFAADKVQISDAPFEVQKTVGTQRPDAAIDSVEKQEKDGRTVYKVEFKNSDQNPSIWVASDGSLVKEKESGLRGLFNAKKLALNDLPVAAQTTAKMETGSSEISSIKEKAKDSRTAYEIEFKQADKSEKILVAADGTILEDSRRKTSIKESAGAEKDKVLKSHRLALTDLPKPVQDTIANESKSANHPLDGIKIRSSKKDGVEAYKVTFDEKGSNTELWIKADGTILKSDK